MMKDCDWTGRWCIYRPVRAYWMLLSLRSVCFVTLTAFLINGATGSAQQDVDSSLRAWALHFPSELPEHVQKTLDRIPDFSRRFLAVSYYFRRVDELQTGWSWTSEEVSDFRGTEEFTRMVEEVERVREIFADSNPGYSLRVNIGARSLGSQIRKWNQVSSVSRAANDFLDSAEVFLLRVSTPDSNFVNGVGDLSLIDSFRVFLQTYEPRSGRVPTVAVPGLSRHGQLGAFDFKVYRRGRMIAGARSATIETAWDRPGWTMKLFEAATTASPRFVGPLAVPYEPWHYNYDPTRDENSPPVTFPSRDSEPGNTEYPEQDDE